MVVKYELRTIDSAQGTLHGLLATPDGAPRGHVLHLHGTWGNFYGNSVVADLAEVYVANGYSFASVNIPGHDETAINERFSMFPDALDAWLDELGFSGPVILQGHSLGAVKIAFAGQSNRLPSNLSGVVLLAPFDVVAFYARGCGGDPLDTLDRVSELQDGAAVPESIFDLWPISVGTLREALVIEGEWDQFPTRRGSVGAFVASCTVPLFVAVGGEDFAATPGPSEVIRLFDSQARATAVLVPSAPHNFAGQESILSEAIGSWLTSVG